MKGVSSGLPAMVSKGFCATCGDFLRFRAHGPAGRCVIHGITIVMNGKTTADPCWYFIAEKTGCDFYNKEIGE